ncbi:hypothetical protein Franean1_2350 [Parafrankia sp. EAN1pec]|nr:hypothetical protein Franean1_2350 [Frankia sp. EAN1pec]
MQDPSGEPAGTHRTAHSDAEPRPRGDHGRIGRVRPGRALGRRNRRCVSGVPGRGGVLAGAAEFRRNLWGHPLGRGSEVVVDDMNRALDQLEAHSYDVIMLSLVLSSMPEPPDFGALRRLLRPGGSLIVTDINPGYTRDNPLYKVWVDGAVVALRITPVDPFEVIRRAGAAGLGRRSRRR